MLWKDLSDNFEKVIPKKYYQEILKKEITPIEEKIVDVIGKEIIENDIELSMKLKHKSM